MTITNRVSLKSVEFGVTSIEDVVDAPTIGTATARVESASVTFTAAATGGAATTFTAISTPGSITGSSATSPITVTGLTGGTSYTFKVYGANASGTWSAVQSAASNSVTPTPSYFESIATVSVGSGGSSTITFSSIPSTYSHLQLRYIAQDNRGTFTNSELRIRFNSDTGSNYRGHYIRGDGSSIEALDTGQLTYMPANVASTSSGSSFYTSIMDILDYANTNKNKTVRNLTGADFNNTGTGPGAIWLRSYLWMSTSAITSITIESNLASSINQYSHFALYGIKAA